MMINKINLYVDKDNRLKNFETNKINILKVPKVLSQRIM